uniref:Large ribosomal subunit protein uL14 n=1 Tax=Nannospalax galili TaxID=1026970 RepID=A0A8C6QL44_NANGA
MCQNLFLVYILYRSQKFVYHLCEGYQGTAAGVGDVMMATAKKDQPELGKKVHPEVSYQRKDWVFLYFEDNTGVIVNNKGEMKGSAITDPVAKKCADLWPRIASNAGNIA